MCVLQEALLALAKAVANATAALVLKAKGVASRCDNQADQNKVIGAATHCALATSQLVACTKVSLPPCVCVDIIGCEVYVPARKKLDMAWMQEFSDSRNAVLVHFLVCLIDDG